MIIILIERYTNKAVINDRGEIRKVTPLEADCYIQSMQATGWTVTKHTGNVYEMYPVR